GLADAGDVLHQQVSLRQQGDQSDPHHFRFSDQHPLHVRRDVGGGSPQHGPSLSGRSLRGRLVCLVRSLSCHCCRWACLCTCLWVCRCADIGDDWPSRQGIVRSRGHVPSWWVRAISVVRWARVIWPASHVSVVSATPTSSHRCGLLHPWLRSPSVAIRLPGGCWLTREGGVREF